MNPRKKHGSAFCLALGVIAMPILYVLAYCGMVNVAVEYDPARREHAPRVAEYRAPLSEVPISNHRLWSQLFFPVHLLDRKARPEAWND